MAAVGIAGALSLAVTVGVADDDNSTGVGSNPETAPSQDVEAATFQAAGLPIGAAPLPDQVDPAHSPNPDNEHERIVDAREKALAARAHAAWHAEQERKAEEQRQQAAASAPAEPSGSVWDRLALCESGGNWAYNGSSGYDGGLQFHPDTWTAYKPADYPAYAYQASREQQIVVGERILADQGWDAWPACASELGLR